MVLMVVPDTVMILDAEQGLAVDGIVVEGATVVVIAVVIGVIVLGKLDGLDGYMAKPPILEVSKTLM